MIHIFKWFEPEYKISRMVWNYIRENISYKDFLDKEGYYYIPHSIFTDFCSFSIGSYKRISSIYHVTVNGKNFKMVDYYDNKIRSHLNDCYEKAIRVCSKNLSETAKMQEREQALEILKDLS